MVYIYVLELVDGKYYVGKTNNHSFGIEQHFNSNSSVWTRKYNPISVLEFISNCDDYDEDKYTRIYMDKYGIENVRGGSFCEEVLDEATLKMLEKMSNSAKNKCFICGKISHFAKECETCNNLEDIDKCLATLETFISDKRELEKIDDKFKQPEPPGFEEQPSEAFRKWLNNSGKNEKLLAQETKRATEQKIKNDEYMPMFEVIHKSLESLNKKLDAQRQTLSNVKMVTDFLSQFSKQSRVSINEEMISQLFGGLFK